MFNKLRQKFIFINMSLLITVFIGIFGTLYIVTNISLNRDTNMTLYDLMRNDHKPKPRSSNIVIDVDNSGNITKKFMTLDISIDNNSLQDITKSVLNKDKQSDKIKFNNSTYMYLKQKTIIGTKIVFLDISYQESFKFKLLQIFTSIGIISLIILLIIIIYLTDKSIKPIKEVFEKQKQFIADASHELKTPLTIIKTNASLILSSPEDSVKNQSKWINYINLQADRMSELVNEMLSLAKLDIEENKLILSRINLSKIIERMLLGFDAVIYENKIFLDTSIGKDIFINGDEQSIKKLLSILMDNAIKHTNTNGKISVNLFTDKNKVKLIVCNTGSGIPDEHLDKIFERFYRVDSARVRETGGYGLGLSIARSITNQHKGNIYAKSILNESATFIVEFPY